MKTSEQELKELFLSEALEQQDELNQLFTRLEHNHANPSAIAAIFRITHTLKANAAAIGFEDLATMAHVLEDVFIELKSGAIKLESSIFNDLFRANDILGALIDNIKNPGQKINYRGIKKKLELLTAQARAQTSEPKMLVSQTTPQNVATNLEVQPQNQSEISAHQQPENSEIVQTQNQESELETESDETNPANETKQARLSFSDSISIPVRKLDSLLDLVGELLIEKDRIIAHARDADTGTSTISKTAEFAGLQRISAELQYLVMNVRLVQMGLLFNKFHRIVRDVSALENKQTNLRLVGTEIEIDRNILQIISDSMIHLVRNSVSHGIETPVQRIALGKHPQGTISLEARAERGQIIIEIKDDGKGIDTEMLARKAIEKGILSAAEANLLGPAQLRELIFMPGFSSAETVSAVSGRGVGMDVVRQAIDTIGGQIMIDSIINQGTTITLQLPSSMALKAALLFETGQNNSNNTNKNDLNTNSIQQFAFPLSNTETVVCLQKSAIVQVGQSLMAHHQGKNLPVFFLDDILAAPSPEQMAGSLKSHQSYYALSDTQKIYLIFVSHNGLEAGFVVGKLLQQKEIVEKAICLPTGHSGFISGGAILDKGHVCLVFDVPALLNLLFKTSKK